MTARLPATDLSARAENFPDIFLPGLYERPVVAVVFFCSYIAIGVWIFWSLLLAVIFDHYKALPACLCAARRGRYVRTAYPRQRHDGLASDAEAVAGVGVQPHQLQGQ